MVPSYPLPEGFSEFDVFALGSCLLVEGKKYDVYFFFFFLEKMIWV